MLSRIELSNQRHRLSRGYSLLLDRLIQVYLTYTGKTTLIKALRSEPEGHPKPTYLLEYSYLRRGFAKKELVHCYDIASKTQTDILPALFSKDTFSSVTAALCLDLSRPGSVIPQVQQWISTLQK